jgi:molybdate transport system substrate-binding protein
MTDIQVLSSIATREAYLELVPQFERATGHRVTTTWAGTVDIMKRMAAGETYDLVMISSESLDELTRLGNIVSGSRMDMARSGIGIAVRAGAPRPDVSSAEALKRALLAAGSVGYSTGPSGVYLAGLFERMGIADAVKAKTRRAPSGTMIGSIVASGEAEIGFQQVSELVHIKGIDYIGPLPAEVQNVTVFSIGLDARAKEPAAAKALAQFLTAPAALPVIRKHGLEPA